MLILNIGLNLTQNSRESKEAAVKTQDQPSDVITERGSESSAQKTVQNHQVNDKAELYINKIE